MIVYRDQHNGLQLNFIWLLDAVKKGAPAAAALAIGAWTMSIHDQASQIPYLERETHTAQQVQALAGPNPIAAIKCLHRKADAAEDQAVKAVIDAGQAPDLKKIPICPPLPNERIKVPH